MYILSYQRPTAKRASSGVRVARTVQRAARVCHLHLCLEVVDLRRQGPLSAFDTVSYVLHR